MIRRVFARAVTAAALFIAARGEASPEDIFGYGARTSAMGATGTAHATGYEAAWHNPALAASIRSNKLTIGYLDATYSLEATGANLPGVVSTLPAKGVVVGADLPIPFGGKLKDRVGIAVAFYTPSDAIVRGRVLYPEKTQFPLVADRSQSLTARVGLGADIGWGVKVGLGVAALAEIEGKVVAATDVTGRVGTQVEDQLIATYAPEIGATWDIPGSSKLRIGAVFRGKLDARFAVTIDGTKLSTLAIPLFNISGTAQYDPAQIALEVARVTPLDVLALQFVFKKWSDYPGILEPTVVCSEGGPGACGLTPPRIPWRDTFAVRIGAEQGFDLGAGVVLRARGGGFVETSALPADVPGSEAFDVPSKKTIEVPTRYFDNTRVVLTTGFGVAFASLPIELDTFVQYHLLMPRTIVSTGPSGELSRGESSGHLKVFGLSAGVKF